MKFRAAALSWVLVCAVGCTALGLTQPQSLDEKIAYVQGIHTAVLNAAASSVESGQLSKADGKAILDMADNAQVFIDGAHDAETTDPSTAAGKLQFAQKALTDLQTYLRSKGAK